MIEHPRLLTLAVCEEENLLSFDPALLQKFEVINFPIVKKRAGLSYPYALMHSLASTPGRYLEAAYLKILPKITKGVLLLNPLVDFTDPHLRLMSKKVDTTSQRVEVFSTINDILLGIFFPDTLDQKDVFFMRYLSCVSATIDFSIIKNIFPTAHLHVLHHKTNLIPPSKTGFFIADEMLTQLKLMAMHFSFSNVSSHEFIAVMPYHAGDLLFFTKAFKEISHHFTRLIVAKEFKDTIERFSPGVEIDFISADSPNRGKNKDPFETTHKNNEVLYFFEEVIGKIPPKHPYYYFRPIRNYNVAEFHLVDQWKYSLSNQPFPFIDETTEAKKTFPPKEKSILIHFDAGWHLKVYPEALQKKLVSLLNNAGYKISVLSDRPKVLDVEQFGFTSLSDLENKIQEHAIFLGGDSFPGHFSIHCLKHPTIMLFSSTSYLHSNAKSSYLYVDLQNGLSCCPCGATNHCPVYNKNYCSNFTAPESVFEKIESMYQSIYGEKN